MQFNSWKQGGEPTLCRPPSNAQQRTIGSTINKHKTQGTKNHLTHTVHRTNAKYYHYLLRLRPWMRAQTVFLPHTNHLLCNCNTMLWYPLFWLPVAICFHGCFGNLQLSRQRTALPNIPDISHPYMFHYQHTEICHRRGLIRSLLKPMEILPLTSRSFEWDPKTLRTYHSFPNCVCTPSPTPLKHAALAARPNKTAYHLLQFKFGSLLLSEWRISTLTHFK